MSLSGLHKTNAINGRLPLDISERAPPKAYAPR
jgi:hypothetical protein